MLSSGEPRPEVWHSKTPDAVAELLKTDLKVGLSNEEAQARTLTFGLNRVYGEKKSRSLALLWSQFKNPLILLLLAAAAVSGLVGEAVDAWVIAAIVAMVVVAGFVQEYRAERVLEALKSRLGLMCTVLRKGETVEIDSVRIVPGDVVVLEAGDRVPADARVIASHSLEVNESSLTGESFVVPKSTRAIAPDSELADRVCMVYLGTTVSYGRGRGVVVATGPKTEFGQLVAQTIEVKPETTPLERSIGDFGKKFGMLAVGIIAVVAGVELAGELLSGIITAGFVLDVLLFGIALAVAAVPEALPAVVTTTLAIGTRVMSRNNALIRKMAAVETLGATEVICFDKTGTLTKGEMTVKEVYAGGATMKVGGVGYDPTGAIEGQVPDASRECLDRLALAASLCNDARLGKKAGVWTVEGDPTEGALLVLGTKMGLIGLDQQYPRLSEVPFSSERKLMTTLHKEGEGGSVAFMKGAPEMVIDRCSQILGDGTARDLSEPDKDALKKVGEEMTLRGLRVLAFGEKPGRGIVTIDKDFESGFEFIGFTGIEDPMRPEAKNAVSLAGKAGMKVVMITGDHIQTATSIAREAGIYREGDVALTGRDVVSLGEGLDSLVEKTTVYARIAPLDKLKIVEAWKRRSKVVAMTGDGVNDAPALQRADIGISMGVTGTDVAKEASDMILTDDNFGTIVKAVELGRWIYDNIRKFLLYLLASNLAEIAVLGLAALVIFPVYGVAGGSLPLLPVQILFINLVTDGFPAIALGVSPPDPGLLGRRPRPAGEGVFTRRMQLLMVTAILVMSSMLLLGLVSGLEEGIDAARTRIFLMFVFMELALALNLRSLTEGIVKVLPHGWLSLSVGSETLLVVGLVGYEPTRQLLHLTLPGAVDIAWIAGAVAATLAGMEGVKAFLRRRYGPG